MNEDHGNGFDEGLREHELFVKYVTQVLQEEPSLVLSVSGEECSPEDYLNAQSLKYLEGALAKYQDGSSDWRVGFSVGFKTAHEKLVKFLHAA
jgi:hypothetical protein